MNIVEKAKVLYNKYGSNAHKVVHNSFLPDALHEEIARLEKQHEKN